MLGLSKLEVGSEFMLLEETNPPASVETVVHFQHEGLLLLLLLPWMLNGLVL